MFTSIREQALPRPGWLAPFSMTCTFPLPPLFEGWNSGVNGAGKSALLRVDDRRAEAPDKDMLLQ